MAPLYARRRARRKYHQTVSTKELRRRVFTPRYIFIHKDTSGIEIQDIADEFARKIKVDFTAYGDRRIITGKCVRQIRLLRIVKIMESGAYKRIKIWAEYT